MKVFGGFFDGVFVFSFTFLFLLGILVLYGFEAGTGDGFFSSVFLHQAGFAVLGGFSIFLISLIDYRYWKSYSTPIFFACMGVLVAVLVWGQVTRGTVGWIKIGTFQIQPVEFVKGGLVIFLASFISQKRAYLHEKAHLVASAIFTLILVFLVLLQPDFGSAMLLLGTWGGITLLSGIRKRYIAILCIVGIFLATTGWFFLAPYQQHRVLTVFSPEMDAQGRGYNVIQALTAIGSGGWFGKGIGYGSQAQLDFLPEKHTDFIFASLVETLGFLGGLVLLGGIVFFLYRILRIARRAPDDFSYLVSVGFFVMFALQSVINIGMNLGVLPVTGVPLPFLSYGGSSLLASCLACGILLNIARQENRNILLSQ